MNILKSLVGFATSGAGSVLWDAVEKFLPNEEAKAQARLAFEEADRKREKDQLDGAIALADNLNQRIAAYEGTASDLKAVPYIGALLLLARGAQRPIWGYAVIWLDYKIYSSAWVIRADQPELTTAFYVINFLVLGFLFGERALVNLLPAIEVLLATMRQKRA